MKIDVYADTTPFDVCLDDNCITISIPKKIVYEYYQKHVFDGCYDRPEEPDDTCEDTEGLYQFAFDKCIYPKLVCLANGKLPTRKQLEDLAELYAEHHGIIEYHLELEHDKNNMVFYSSFPMEHATYRCVVNLLTMKEKRTKMDKYYVAYESKIGGMYTANYCA